MGNAEENLRLAFDPGPDTQFLQREVGSKLGKLKDALEEELERRQDQQQQQQDQQPQPSGPSRPPLVPPVAELVMLKRLQAEVLDRTERLEAERAENDGELDPFLERSLDRLLSQQQGKIFGAHAGDRQGAQASATPSRRRRSGKRLPIRRTAINDLSGLRGHWPRRADYNWRTGTLLSDDAVARALLRRPRCLSVRLGAAVSSGRLRECSSLDDELLSSGLDRARHHPRDCDFDRPAQSSDAVASFSQAGRRMADAQPDAKKSDNEKPSRQAYRGKEARPKKRDIEKELDRLTGSWWSAEERVEKILDDMTRNMKEIEELLSQRDTGQSTTSRQKQALGQLAS